MTNLLFLRVPRPSCSSLLTVNLLQLGLTALHIAAWKGHTSVVEFLIQSGADLLAKAQNGKTALQLAQEENQHECATILTAATSKVHFLLRLPCLNCNG